MLYDEELEKLKVFDTDLPAVNPVIKDLLKKQRKEPKEKEKEYRCNACKKLTPASQTDLYQYNPVSNRRHRVCLKCIRLLTEKVR